MGCGRSIKENPGEVYVTTICSNFKGNSLKFKEIDEWITVSANLKLISEEDFRNFLREFIEYDTIKNPNCNVQEKLMLDLFGRQKVYNCYFIELVLLSMLNEFKKDKLTYFWQLIGNLLGLKGKITYQNFKDIFLEYLMINLRLNTLSLSEIPDLKSPIKLSMKQNLEAAFNIENINLFNESLIKTFENGRKIENGRYMNPDDFYNFFNTDLNYESFMNLSELRGKFLLFLEGK